MITQATTSTTNAQQEDRLPSMVDKKNVQMRVKEVYFAHPLSQNTDPSTSCDICLDLEDESGETHIWRSEYSLAYGKPGSNFANKTRAEIAVDTLAKIGWQGGHDLSRLENDLTNKVIIASVKWNNVNGKWYKTVYLGENGPRRMDKNMAINIIQAITAARSNAPQTTSFGSAPAANPQSGWGSNAAASSGFSPFK